jgi:hypothetical protein
VCTAAENRRFRGEKESYKEFGQLRGGRKKATRQHLDGVPLEGEHARAQRHPGIVYELG